MSYLPCGQLPLVSHLTSPLCNFAPLGGAVCIGYAGETRRSTSWWFPQRPVCAPATSNRTYRANPVFGHWRRYGVWLLPGALLRRTNTERYASHLISVAVCIMIVLMRLSLAQGVLRNTCTKVANIAALCSCTLLYLNVTCVKLPSFDLGFLWF